MSLVEKCWMVTSNVSVIAVLIITGICFGIFVRPYMKKKKEAIAVSTVYIAVMLVLYIVACFIHCYNPPFCFAKVTNRIMKILVSLATLVSIFPSS